MSEAGQVRLRPANDPPCPKHSTAEAIFVCLENGCQESIACIECIIVGGAHNKHEITSLAKHLETFQKKIKDYNMNTREMVLAPLKKKVAQVAEDLSAFDPATTTLVKEIEAKGEQIKDYTDTLITEFKTKCNQIRASNRQLLEQYQSRLLAKIIEVEADISALDNCLTGQSKEGIVDAAKTGVLKTYPCLEYPTGLQDVAFIGSDIPVKDVSKLIGKVQIGNEFTREESDDEKIKRLEGQVMNLTQEIERDQALLQRMKEEMRDNTEKIKRDQTLIEKMKEDMKRNADTMDTDKDQIKTLQANNERLAKELRDQTRVSEVSEKRTMELEQKIQELEKRLICSVCGISKETCICITCPKCSYQGANFLHIDDYWVLECPKCHHIF